MQDLYTGMTASSIPGAQWRKSSWSDDAINCVEVCEPAENQVAVRDSKAPDGPALVFGRGTMIAFVEGSATGDLAELTV
ncbi:DUF397 domain-containing protein [Streptomyces sp. NPDC059698]|uniref:DUF397 domain-containing protein n=1 Tax=unclassified Streptomyces TaxID=2593676 RepID=UPI00093CFE5B|nr:DUF397 domain-containing protein [Streptomyces sp. CB02366]OKJ35513.1 hypothetical protein AMK24_20290 [Streptomyces sp. CB02366]TVP33871.1 hypothetical protein A3L22_15770 [Streptomyces griseus subsp. griseus]WSS58816.1 DUF397 domain-containing protein [Streptomyces sp. NBC_01178]